MPGCDEGNGFTDYPGQTIVLIVTAQRGRIFAGHLVLSLNGTALTAPVAGAISRDGRTFSLVEKEFGYATGEIVSADEIEFTWMHDGTPYGIAVDTLKRS